MALEDRNDCQGSAPHTSAEIERTQQRPYPRDLHAAEGRYRYHDRPERENGECSKR